jgi:hypothetical protein
MATPLPPWLWLLPWLLLLLLLLLLLWPLLRSWRRLPAVPHFRPRTFGLGSEFNVTHVMYFREGEGFVDVLLFTSALRVTASLFRSSLASCPGLIDRAGSAVRT